MSSSGEPLSANPRAAVKLAAYSEAIYAARQEAREQNKTAATARAQSLARMALDDAAFTRLQREGAALCDAEIVAVAFDTCDAG